MGWFKLIDRLIGIHETSAREFSDQGYESAEALEQRLVLGSLSPLPVPGQAADVASSATQNSNNTPLDFAATVKDSVAEKLLLRQVDSAQQASEIIIPTNIAQTRLESAQAPSMLMQENGLNAIQDSLPSNAAQNVSLQLRVAALQNALIPNAGDEESPDSAEETDSAAPKANSSSFGIERLLLDASQGVLDNRNGESAQFGVTPVAWFEEGVAPVQVHYDFRDLNGVGNEISEEQQAMVDVVLIAWSEATEGRIQWVRDTDASAEEIVVIGIGDLNAVNLYSNEGGTLGVAGSYLQQNGDTRSVIGTVWLDIAENWENNLENGNPDGTVDFFTVMAHEIGHVIGLQDQVSDDGLGVMDPGYTVERSRDAIADALDNAMFFPMTHDGSVRGYALHNMMMGFPQLAQGEVNTLLERASAATSSEDAIIAIVDRNGTILGVRAEQDVLNTFVNPADLAFAIDGAVSKARTAAFFANDTAPLTSRLVRFISQSTVTEREVDSNPNITDPNSTERGPGFIAPIGLGGHFPPDINFTPPVDLFGIEHTNRDSLTSPGPDRIMGTGDDVALPYRFNIDPANVPAGQEIVAPISYGDDAGIAGVFQNRGIATLPGGIPIYRDTNADGIGDTLIGGIGVFFPGEDGYATFEQGFVAGVGQTPEERTNAPKVLEAEFIAVAAVGGSMTADHQIPGAEVGDIAGIPPVDGIDIPFGCLSLVGINLQVIGPQAGILGVKELVDFAQDELAPGAVSGANQILGGGVFLRDGASVADGTLVTSQNSAVDNLTSADVDQIIDAAIAAANEVRAAVRLQEDGSPSARTRMVFAITDTTGEVLGLYRMEDATVFSIDVAVAKARNVAYFADAGALQPEDQIAGIDPGVAFTNRTFRFIAEPRFPDGIDGTDAPVFSILQDAAAAGIDPLTGENIGAPAAASVFQSVLGYDAFNPNTNFRDPDNLENQNGIVFFPGSTPLYKDGVLVGGLGVSGDGVDQDDVVTFLAAQGFLPDGVTVGRADQEFVDGVRLPYMKFLRNPFG